MVESYAFSGIDSSTLDFYYKGPVTAVAFVKREEGM